MLEGCFKHFATISEIFRRRLMTSEDFDNFRIKKKNQNKAKTVNPKGTSRWIKLTPKSLYLFFCYLYLKCLCGFRNSHGTYYWRYSAIVTSKFSPGFQLLSGGPKCATFDRYFHHLQEESL